MKKNSSALSLENASKNLNLLIEAYSSEPGVGFQEHFVIANGIILVNECLDYFEAYIEDWDEDKLTKLSNNENKSVEAIKESVRERDGYYCYGGFGDNYGDYSIVFGIVQNNGVFKI